MKDSTKDLLEAVRQLEPPKINEGMEDHSQDPAVLRKLAAAKERLKNVKFPDDWKEWQDKK